MTTRICKILCAMTMCASVNSANAQSVENVFIGGSRYVYDIYASESLEQQIARLPNKIIVPHTMMPQMAKMYRDCARSVKFRRKVRAIGNVYSSHFSAVTLERHPSMSSQKFSASVACVKSRVIQNTPPQFM